MVMTSFWVETVQTLLILGMAIILPLVVLETTDFLVVMVMIYLSVVMATTQS